MGKAKWFLMTSLESSLFNDVRKTWNFLRRGTLEELVPTVHSNCLLLNSMYSLTFLMVTNYPESTSGRRLALAHHLRSERVGGYRQLLEAGIQGWDLKHFLRPGVGEQGMLAFLLCPPYPVLDPRP